MEDQQARSEEGTVESERTNGGGLDRPQTLLATLDAPSAGVGPVGDEIPFLVASRLACERV